MKAPFMESKQIYVRALEKEDLPLMIPWINDHEVTRLLFTGVRPATIEGLSEIWEKEYNSPNDVVFAVCMKEDDKFIGTTGLYCINWIMRTAEFRVFLGEKSYWNRGIGTEATKLMVAYGFEKLNLNNVWLGVTTANKGGGRAYEKAGFIKEGILRQVQYRNFQYYDAVRMSILRHEYEKIRENYMKE